MVDGGFYAVYPSHRVFQFHNISDVDATLIEPASCAAHGMDRIAPKLGSKVLFGAGPTGLMLAQMLRLYGASHLVIDAPGGPKMDLVRSLDAHSTVQMNMSNVLVPKKQGKRLVRTYKARTRTVLIIDVRATGSAEVFEDSINFVREGGKLVAYGVYPDDARCRLSPKKVFKEEINIIGSFSQVYKFPAAIDYLVEWCPPHPLDGNRMIVKRAVRSIDYGYRHRKG